MIVHYRKLLVLLFPLALGSFFYVGNFRSYLPALLAASLPSALWAFSLHYTLRWIWEGSHQNNLIALPAISMTITAGFEWMQLVGLLSGTFDWEDVFLAFAGIVLADLANLFGRIFQ
jgi:hypothetical protein